MHPYLSEKKYTDRSFALRFWWLRIFYKFIPFPPNCCQESFYFTPDFRHTMDFNNNHRGKKEWAVKFKRGHCPLPLSVLCPSRFPWHQSNKNPLCSVRKNPVFLLTASFLVFLLLSHTSPPWFHPSDTKVSFRIP